MRRRRCSNRDLMEQRPGELVGDSADYEPVAWFEVPDGWRLLAEPGGGRCLLYGDGRALSASDLVNGVLGRVTPIPKAKGKANGGRRRKGRGVGAPELIQLDE